MRTHGSESTRTGRISRAGRARFAAAIVGLLAIAGVTLPAATASAAAAGVITDPVIRVTSDGDKTTSPVVDNDLHNDIVGTNDTVCFSWSFSSPGATDSTFSQALPVGWTWTETSLITLVSNSTLYQSSYVITGDAATGQTLTATVSVPDGSSIILLGPLCAVPTGGAEAVAYTPTLTVTDGAGPETVTAPDVTVVGTPKMDVSKFLYRAQTYTQHDFGSGLESAAFIDYRILIQQPLGTPSYGSQATAFPDPFTIDESFTLTPSVPTVDVELLEASSGVAVLSGTDIVVSGATDVGNTPWGITYRMWFRSSELPTAAGTPAFVAVENTATVNEGFVDEDPSNNTALGNVQAPILGDLRVDSGKELLAADDPDNPVYNVDPNGVVGYTPVTSGIVSPGAVVFSRFYLGVRDRATNGVVGATNVVDYDFWNPAFQHLHGTEANIFVGEAGGPALASTQYEITYTTQDGTGLVDPETLTWFPRTDPAFDVTTVSGIKIRYLGDGSPDPVYSGSWFLSSVPFDIVAPTDQTVVDTAKFTLDEVDTVDQWTRFVNTSTNVLSLTKSVDKAAITSGGVLTYTLQPAVNTPIGGDPSAVTGVTVVDSLPSSIISVDTSGVSADWSVVQTPGDPGPDGIPGNTDDVSGISLRFTYLPNSGEVTTGTPLAAVVFTATTAALRPASGTIINSAVISADQNAQALEARTATAVTTVAQADVLGKTKVADYPQIEVWDPQASWTSTWFNFQSGPQGMTSFVDVLPYNGDGRGTNFDGTAVLATATLLGQESGTYVLEYTTDAAASVGSAPATSTTWLPAPVGGDFTGVTGVTALRVTLPVFTNGEAGIGGLRVALDVAGNSDGDLYANTLTGRVNVDPQDPTAGQVFPAGAPALVRVVASDISGQVWADANGNAIDDGESGMGGVSLALVDSLGVPVIDPGTGLPLTTTTALDGSYLFEDIHSGTYRVVATPPAGAVNTYDLDGTFDSDSGDVVLPADSERVDVDFGYQLFAGLVVNKVIVGPGGETFGTGPFVFSVVCTFDGNTVADQTVTLTPLAGASVVTSDPITGLPVGTTCVVTETDAAGADTTPAPAQVQIVADTTVVAEITNEFSQGTVELAKVLEGTASDDEYVAGLEFEVLVTCQIDTVDELGAPVRGTLFSGTVAISGGETLPVLDLNGDPVLLPLGAHCFGEETDNGGAGSSSVDVDSFDNAAIVGVSDDEQLLSITATNEFDTAEIVVEKIVAGPGAAGPYSFELECAAPNGDDYPLGSDAEFTLSHGESRTVETIVGATCVVTETDVPTGAVVSVVDTDASTEGGTSDGVVVASDQGQAVTVTNTFRGAALASTGVDSTSPLLLGSGALLLGGVIVAAGAVRRKRAA